MFPKDSGKGVAMRFLLTGRLYLDKGGNFRPPLLSKLPLMAKGILSEWVLWILQCTVEQPGYRKKRRGSQLKDETDHAS